MRYILFYITFLLLVTEVFSQGCCSGGSGSPIAGGASQGVLPLKELELSASYQHLSSKKFYSGSKDTTSLFDEFQSNYLYLRTSYGLRKDLTISLDAGYYINKTIFELNDKPDFSSGGIGDIILFPRYEIYSKKTDSAQYEITTGIGYKFPAGSFNDSSVVYTDLNGQNWYTTSPPAIQATNGSHDFIIYLFGLRGFPKHNLKLFTNIFYIKKGWNPLGQKFGDYANIGFFVSWLYRHKYGFIMQLKGEWMDKMKAAPYVDLLGLYNIDMNSTGYYKLSISPQFNYTYKKITAFALCEIPVFQHYNGIQVGSGLSITVGLAYRICI